MFARRRRRMNRQAQAQEQEQEDFEFCACDVCMRELRRVAEKEALEAAAKQQLMVSLFEPTCCFPSPLSIFTPQPGAFPADGRGSGNWISGLAEYDTIPLPCILDPLDR